jgi:hypothetical protein
MTRRSGANHLVAVFDDRRAADAARQALLRLGLDRDEVVIGDGDDHVASLRAEMQSEVADGIATLPFVSTSRGRRGFATVAVLGTAIALVLAVPLAFIDIGGEYWLRYLFVAGFLALLAWTIGFVVGFGMGMNRPEERMAAERGVTLHVPSTPAARGLLERRQPIRLDEVDATGEPVQVIHSEGEGDGAVRGGLRDNLATDDFSPPPGPDTTDR